MQEKPLILVTNDDGITAPGIRALIKIMNKIGILITIIGMGSVQADLIEKLAGRSLESLGEYMSLPIMYDGIQKNLLV